MAKSSQQSQGNRYQATDFTNRSPVAMLGDIATAIHDLCSRCAALQLVCCLAPVSLTNDEGIKSSSYLGTANGQHTDRTYVCTPASVLLSLNLDSYLSAYLPWLCCYPSDNVYEAIFLMLFLLLLRERGGVKKRRNLNTT